MPCLRCLYECNEDDFAAGLPVVSMTLLHCSKQHLSVLGPTSTTCVAGNSQYALDLAVAEVVQAGVSVMVAAGNEDTDACLKSPARYIQHTCEAFDLAHDPLQLAFIFTDLSVQICLQQDSQLTFPC